MSLASFDLNNAAQELREAAQVELPKVEILRNKVRALTVQELGYRQCLAVAPVATDGGENRLSFDPLNVEILRVADSEGREHFQKFIPLGGNPEQIQKLFEDVPLLKIFLDRIKVPYRDLSFFLPGNKREPAEEEAKLGPSDEDLRKYVRSFRDIAEWAVVLDLAYSGKGVKMLVIRDGLLRSKSMSIKAMEALAKAFKQAYQETGAMLVGVAKRSKVLSYLSLALALEETLRKPYPCFVEVNKELEEECYNFAGTWMQGQAFGKMHLAKLVEGRDAPVFPIDIPEWLMDRRKEVLEYLAETAKASYPTPGYPQPLVRAHENANLQGLEMSVLGDMLVKTVADQMANDEVERVIRHVSLGRGLVLGGTKGDG
jgi:hypothetical protein